MTTLPWWLSAALLGMVTVGHWLLVRRPLGVSGVLGRVASFREEREAERAAAEMRADAAALEAAMLAATEEAARAGDLRGRAADAAPGPVRGAGPMPPLSAHATFLVALVAGGLLARLAGGGPTLEPGLPAALVARVGQPGALAALAVGGLLAGFGAAAAGGCTSGHGLTGCARLAPGSLAATVTFLGAAVAASIALARLA